MQGKISWLQILRERKHPTPGCTWLLKSHFFTYNLSLAISGKSLIEGGQMPSLDLEATCWSEAGIA